ncbi:hypothetical protein TcYC6_0017770 [Trypanosoma cruzi]|uniref:Uncharacterized protein n=2 Tax=Trypanosoma cruzi TaxID=5693 RepID=Q4DGA8_TRYCC|nr:hypothetical protein, conserved [Trypanosoma cruzi]EAN91564.1 hypothetical protein, conserved [Trypanosoma cruzi]KAF5226085.1 hypothetical protein ECC02_000646 [Trypanosoma cruzi]KAF8277262.1 hypothetical protein TcYC6_0017770 [Trypanosoma cruzi]RNC56543.1 hypothetical protein TcCL_ESM05908 [Trypanosoma cruzi]|eukprot:XP_813415.1 hypothetical protein [Trypanosoma cruzi strain CL Brener]
MDGKMDYSCEGARLNRPNNKELVCYGAGPTWNEGRWAAHPQLPGSMGGVTPAPRHVNAIYTAMVRRHSDQLQPKSPNVGEPKQGKAIVMNSSLFEKGSSHARSNNCVYPYPPSIKKMPMGMAAPHWSPVASRIIGRNYGDLSDIYVLPRDNERNGVRMIEAGPGVINNNNKRAIPAVSSVTGLPVVARGPQPSFVEPTRFKENNYMRLRCCRRPKTRHLGNETWFQGTVHAKRVISPPPSPKRGLCETPCKQGEVIKKKETNPPAKTSKFLNAFMNLFK